MLYNKKIDNRDDNCFCDNKENIINQTEQNKFYGFCEKNFFHNIIINQIYTTSDFSLENVDGDGNCGFRALSLQIYNGRSNYNIIRTHIYNYLNNNIEIYKNQYTIYNNEIIRADLYIPKIKLDGN